MGESREGEGGGREAATQKLIQQIADLYEDAEFTLRDLRLNHMTGRTFGLHLGSFEAGFPEDTVVIELAEAPAARASSPSGASNDQGVTWGG